MSSITKIFHGTEFFLYESGHTHASALSRSRKIRCIRDKSSHKRGSSGVRIGPHEGNWAIWLQWKSVPGSGVVVGKRVNQRIHDTRIQRLMRRK